MQDTLFLQEDAVIKDLLKDAEHRMHSAIHVLEEDLAAARMALRSEDGAA